MKSLALIATAILVCAATQNPPVAKIPRFRGPFTGEDARYVGGMNYDPDDIPLAWLPANHLLVGHHEGYSAGDVGYSTCSGTGFYLVSLATGTANAVAVGQPACDALQTREGTAAGPQGRWIVYSMMIPDNRSALFRLDLSNLRIDTLMAGCRVYHEQPAVSPDGQRIVAQGLCEGRNQDHYRIYVSGVDGTGLHPIPTNDATDAEMPTWSPDGLRIAFQSGATSGQTEIAILDTTGQNRRVLTRGRLPAWSPDGRWIAFLSTDFRNETLRVIRPDGSGEHVVFRNKERGTYSRGWGPIPEGLPRGPLLWSPDSQWIAFTRSFDGGTSIWRVNTSSGQAVQITAPDHR